jgi:hypothetical protein
MQLHQHEEYKVVHIRPRPGYRGVHIYVTNGLWAFDHCGWTEEAELLATMKAYNSKLYPKWDYDLQVVTVDLETFCKQNNHRLPWQFAYLPWDRAYNFVSQFSFKPPAIK